MDRKGFVPRGAGRVSELSPVLRADRGLSLVKCNKGFPETGRCRKESFRLPVAEPMSAPTAALDWTLISRASFLLFWRRDGWHGCFRLYLFFGGRLK